MPRHLQKICQRYKICPSVYRVSPPPKSILNLKPFKQIMKPDLIPNLTMFALFWVFSSCNTDAISWLSVLRHCRHLEKLETPFNQWFWWQFSLSVLTKLSKMLTRGFLGTPCMKSPLLNTICDSFYFEVNPFLDTYILTRTQDEIIFSLFQM